MKRTEQRDHHRIEVSAAAGFDANGVGRQPGGTVLTATMLTRLDRLREIARIVEGRHCTTLKYLSSRYEMSEQMVARDIAELRRIGVNIAGGPTVGYTMEGCDDKGLSFLFA